MDWKFLFTSFEGRINRQPFWIGTLLLCLTNLVVYLLFGEGVIGLIISLILIVPAFAVLIKRCHDRNKSGWWSLISVVPVIGLIWIIIDLGILPGTPGVNEYGPDPLS